LSFCSTTAGAQLELDARIKAADELIANADSDRRGVALVPLSEPARDITLMPGAPRGWRLRQLVPKPYSIERVESLPAIERFLKTTGNCEDRLACRMASIPGEDRSSRRLEQDNRRSRVDGF